MKDARHDLGADAGAGRGTGVRYSRDEATIRETLPYNVAANVVGTAYGISRDTTKTSSTYYTGGTSTYHTGGRASGSIRGEQTHSSTKNDPWNTGGQLDNNSSQQLHVDTSSDWRFAARGQEHGGGAQPQQPGGQQRFNAYEDNNASATAGSAAAGGWNLGAPGNNSNNHDGDSSWKNYHIAPASHENSWTPGAERGNYNTMSNLQYNVHKYRNDNQ
ncbi:unnamed protein product [Amoebophrya sp. A25]|nr:unnamed protein product [Amoebophrya sp. A25]CAD7977006.1 unnamed protein product [Amoebophrya sp. A25]|eukprot:GSA25T00027724001.1